MLLEKLSGMVSWHEAWTEFVESNPDYDNDTNQWAQRLAHLEEGFNGSHYCGGMSEEREQLPVSSQRWTPQLGELYTVMMAHCELEEFCLLGSVRLPSTERAILVYPPNPTTWMPHLGAVRLNLGSHIRYEDLTRLSDLLEPSKFGKHDTQETVLDVHVRSSLECPAGRIKFLPISGGCLSHFISSNTTVNDWCDENEFSHAGTEMPLIEKIRLRLAPVQLHHSSTLQARRVSAR